MRLLVLLVGITLGLGLIFLVPTEEEPPREAPPRARVTQIRGNAWLIPNGSLERQALQRGDAIRDLDAIQTPELSEVEITFEDSGAQVRVMGGTYVLLDQSSNGATQQMIVLQGRAQLKNRVDERQFILFQNVPELQVSEIQLEGSAPELTAPTPTPDVAEATPQPATSPAAPPKSLPPRPSQGASLSQEYLDSVLKAQERFARSCYLKYFQRMRGRVDTGRVLMGFVVEPNGRVSRANVIHSEISDSEYLDCLTSVVLRTRFQAFQGQPIDIEYPIDVVLPR